MFRLNNNSKKKDQRTYKNFKFWPTEKLKGVIDNPNHCGIDGADYDGHIDEIKEVYFLRVNIIMENNVNAQIEQRG